MKVEIIGIALSLSLALSAQEIVVHSQKAFSKEVPAGNYSGIAWLGGSRYAIVNDKSNTAGFHLMTIETDSITGDILSVKADTFLTSGLPNRDEEGVCYVPQTNTLFVSGEADGQVMEYDLQGQLTGRRLDVPAIFNTAYSNGSLEALTYQPETHRSGLHQNILYRLMARNHHLATEGGIACACKVLVTIYSLKNNIGMRVTRRKLRNNMDAVSWA